MDGDPPGGQPVRSISKHTHNETTIHHTGIPDRSTRDPVQKLKLNPNPCDTCPYRKDTPSGIWAREEYEKLPKWDNPHNFAGIFHCHNQTADRPTVCRGWLEVHEANLQVRLTVAMHIEFDEHNIKPTPVPLHESGAAAMEAGMRRIENPSIQARQKVTKLSRKGKFKYG